MPDTLTEATLSPAPARHVDVLIVGAGLSGIGAAWWLQKQCPGKTYAILEQRDAIGGTWDLFRYPGIRSDSDMYTLGYAFRPWKEAKAIADGPSILKYVRDTAAEAGIDQHIRFHHKVVSASWDSETARWTVTAETEGRRVTMSASFLMMCSGYYRYEAGYAPTFPGQEDFKGRIVHPQKWTEDIDHANKNVVVIGSGATAVTLVPEMAKTAKHVTMLQRSPTYIVSRPAEDRFANWLRKWMPAKMAYGTVRWRNVLMGMYFYNRARKAPEKVAKFITGLARKALGPDYDVQTHLTPKYNPWDQRVCLIPDGDLFEALRHGTAEIVTDQIERFTEAGIHLKSGKDLPADLIVTATGLDLLFLGGMKVIVDGREVDMPRQLTYKGMMYSGVPNLVSVFGYTNASWTLKCDLTCEYACNLLNWIGDNGYDAVTPRNTDPEVKEEPWLDFTSGYVQRSLERFPKQGSRKPWKLHQNYARDMMSMRFSKIDDPALEFSTAKAKVKEPA
ncbi:MAG: NAD(P)/FAD-dependent oxidoreductase [Hyphomonadaceae bacterium]